ncbi:MAG: hypothetical protein NPINA01_21540 [Nitrospinaceae bacterium]|jgi:hypothetical protein|nr:MAG: hypothetical protein NPINA01_21540 [Nitrospinaceae bacterium]
MAKKATKTVLDEARNQLRVYIEKNYETVEQFCWDKDLNKATVSNFLNEKKDFQVSTLEKIAKAMGKKLSIRFE